MDPHLLKDASQHREWAVIDHTAVPAFIDAAWRVSVLTVMFAERERRGNNSQHGQDQQGVSHEFLVRTITIHLRDNVIPKPRVLTSGPGTSAILGPRNYGRSFTTPEVRLRSG